MGLVLFADRTFDFVFRKETGYAKTPYPYLRYRRDSVQLVNT